MYLTLKIWKSDSYNDWRIVSADLNLNIEFPILVIKNGQPKGDITLKAFFCIFALLTTIGLNSRSTAHFCCFPHTAEIVQYCFVYSQSVRFQVQRNEKETELIHLDVNGWTQWTCGLESRWCSADRKKSSKYFWVEKVVRQRFYWRGLASKPFLGKFGGFSRFLCISNFHRYGFKISIVQWVLGGEKKWCAGVIKIIELVSFPSKNDKSVRDSSTG